MRLDSAYTETDHIHPHFGHVIQPLDDGAWVCVSCGEFHDWMLDEGYTTIEWTDDGLEVS